jgi:hypothetical protein
LRTEKPSERAAACCSFGVVKGGAGFWRFSRASTETDAQLGALDVLADFLGGLVRREARVAAVEVQLLAAPADDASRERRLALRERQRHREVRDRDEGFALGLALDDDAERHRLDAAGAEPPPDLVPEQLRDLVADQAVDDAARLLGADAVLRDLAGLLDRALDGGLGDLVELGPVEGGVRRLLLEQLVQVPADRLALAVGVGRQEHALGFLDQARQLRDRLLFSGHHPVLGLVVLGTVDREPFTVQIADVSVGSGDGEVLAEELSEGARLGRRLDDDEGSRHETQQDATPVKPLRRPGAQGRPRAGAARRTF